MSVAALEAAAARAKDPRFAQVLRQKAGQAAVILQGVAAPVLRLKERARG